MGDIFPDTHFTPDPYKNKIFLCKEYPFSNYNHVYYNENGHNYDRAKDLKENTYKFAISYHPDTSDSTPSTFITSRVDLTRGRVRVPLPYHQGIDYNYMIITDSSASKAYNKDLEYYYCFIDDLEFSTNGHSCTIHFHIDYWNTFVNKIDFNKSYIEREHVMSDTPGYHVIDEGLTPSNYTVEEWSQENLLLTNMVPLIAVGGNNNMYREGPNQSNPAPARVLYASDNYGYNPLLIGPLSASSADPLAEIAEAVDILTRAGQADAILGIYLMPDEIVTPGEDVYVVTGRDPDGEILRPPTTEYERIKAWYTTNTAQEKVLTITKPEVDVKNAKTLTYPFCFVNASNQLGNELTLKFENNSVNKNQVSFSRLLDRNINGAMYMVAMNYDHRSKNLDYSIQSFNYPTIPFVIDSYDAYIASNKNVIANSKNYIDNDYNFRMSQGAIEAETSQTLANINNIVNSASGVASGNAAAGPTGILNYFTDLFSRSQSAQLKINAYDYDRQKGADAIKASLADKANMPDKFCGRYIPNLLMAYNNPGFIVKTMIAMPEELQAIDDYFSRYGYKVNKFGTPQLQIRPVFDYKKIIDVNLTGQLPNNAINVIKGAFNNGITLWHDKAQLFQFDAENASPF